MPRFSYRKEFQKNKDMAKSKPTPSSKSSPDSPSRKSSRRSAPTPSASSSLQGLSNDGDGAKTPASILKSGRYRIQVPRTGKGEDGYADDSPYWEAAKRASTQDSPPDSSESSSSDEGEKIDPKELERKEKQKEKQKKKRADIEELKNQYKEGQAKLKTNFNVGIGSQSENSDNEEGGSDQGEWLKTSLQRNGKRAAMFSPSDLSRASTIPPTPASTKKTNTPSSSKQQHTPSSIKQQYTPSSSKQQHTPSSSKQQQSMDEEISEDDDFHISHNDDDSGHEEEEQEKAPLSPIHEEHVVNEARTNQNDNNDLLEENISDVLGKTNLSEDVGGSSEMGFQQNDDYSVGGDDDNDGVGFELADNQPSPQASFSDNEDETKSPKEKKSNRKKSIDPEGSDENQSNSEARSKRSKKIAKRKESIDSEGSNDNQRNSESRSKISKKRKSKRRESIDSEESDSKKKPKKRGRGRPKKVKISAPFGGSGYQTGPREYKTIPADHFEDDDYDDGVRRSRRRKFTPLLFWKNEKVVYEANREEGDLAEVYGDMPMVAGVQKAQPTPYKKRTVSQKSDSDDDDEVSRRAVKKSQKNSSEIKPYDSKKLRKKHDIDDGDTAPIWWDSQGMTLDKSKFLHLTQHETICICLKLTIHNFFISVEVICYNENITLHDLPLVKKRSKSEGKIVAKAAQAFNVDPPGDGMPGFICGCMEVPPQGIKDEEGVGPCFQVFNVGECQPKSIELAIADPDTNDGNYESESAKRFLLSKGDMFQIPAGNVYRIQNHSKTVACTLNWTIIRPAPKDE